MRRPRVHVTYAQSLDGCIATSSGESQWISCPESLVFAHELRAASDAIMVGIGTVLKDDPLLNARLPQAPTRQPLRVILDAALRLPEGSKLTKSAAEFPLLVVSAPETKIPEHFRDHGIQVERVRCDAGHLDLFQVLDLLAERGCETVMVEGGRGLLTSLFKNDLVDRFSLVTAPIVIGDGLRAISDIGVASLSRAIRFRDVDHFFRGTDSIRVMERVNP